MIVRQRHWCFRALKATIIALCVLSFANASAFGKIVHQPLSSFNGGDAPGGPFGVTLSAAVDNSGGPSNGDVYIGELSETFVSAVDKFDENGAYAGVQITGAETPQGSFSFVSFSTFLTSGIAVDSSSSVNKGDLYVADIEHGVVDKFDESGHYVCQITGSALPSLSECNGVAGSTTPTGSITPRGVAVDASGDVYVTDVADIEHGVVDKFGPSGEYLGQITDSHLTQPGAIAIDSSGNLYVDNGGLFTGLINVVKLDASGSFLSEVDSNSPGSVAVDPANNHVFVPEGGEPTLIAEFDSAGNKLDLFGKEQSGHSTAEAVAGATGKVYAGASGASEISIYGPLIVVPEVTTDAATDVQQTSATLNGLVQPDLVNGGGNVTSCEFEYVTDKQFQEHPQNRYEGAAVTPCSPSTPYSNATNVSANATVAPSTTYHFRISAADAEGTNRGEGEEKDEDTFTTFGPPVVDSESSTVMPRRATVRAQINPFGIDTSCHVQYVDETGFQSSGYTGATTLPCTPSDLGSGFGDQSTSAILTGLQIGTTYHFRFIATNQAGTTAGTDETFVTFGVNSFKFEVLDQEGQPYTQAGGHPYELTTSFNVNTTNSITGELAIGENLKDVETELPPGLIGNPSATPKCTRAELAHAECSGASQVGMLHLRSSHGAVFDDGLYNLVPPAGIPAEFGARFNSNFFAYIDANVRTGGDYGVTADVVNIPAAIGITRVALDMWGVPADPSHDATRECPVPSVPGTPPQEAPPCSANTPLLPFLTNPTSCPGPQTTTLRVDSWQDPGDFLAATSTLPAITGCDRLDFTPSTTLQPDTGSADTPSGLHADLRIPQNENHDGLAEANLKQAVVTLPAGMSVSPSAANGLQACSPAQVALESARTPTCPDASKIGTVEIDTPLLSDHLKGGVYIAQQGNNPFGSLLAIYVTADADGAVVKLAGHIVADPITGQLTTTFDNSPQLPFSELKLDLSGGPLGALATPESCGKFTMSTSLVSWSETLPVGLSEPFQISSGCVSGLSPTFSAGVTNPQAGASSPFALSFSRSDTDQELSGLSVSLPPGLLAKIAGVPLCSDAAVTAAAHNSGAAEQANPSCPPASQVGTVQTAVGPGPNPFFASGKAYLTGPYKGAPYALAVVVPALAGPFDLGTVVVRQALHIDPIDAHVTATSDPFPTILQGIPLRLRRVDIAIDRPGFTFNPTNCNPMAITGALTSTGGLSAPVSSRFQISDCGALPFKPSFSAATQGKTSKANGASLTVKVAQRLGEANIHKVDLQLPKALPSRLTTLQKACTEAQFSSNPAGCPEASKIGTAIAITPVLNAPLSGPAYLVSHGGTAFPDIEFLLEGEGVHILLDGKTSIKKGITYSRFETVPDAPISSFEANFPQGPHSVLAANGNLCATKTVTVKKRVARRAHGRVVHIRRPVKQQILAPLLMPTTITGQNGATVTHTTKIAITGCSRPKHIVTKATHRRKAGSKRRKK